MTRLNCVLVAVALALAVSGCSTSSDAETTAETGGETGFAPCEPTLDSIATTIFETSCLGGICHSGSDPAAGLDLSADAGLEGRLVSVPAGSCGNWVRVAPGDAEASFLVHKLEQGTPDCGGLQMPPTQAPLPDAQLACIRGWIDTVDGPGCETCGGSACVDLSSDALNCGACGATCPSGVACDGGTCSCPAGTTSCGDACIDTQSDGANCGGCQNACDAGQFCLEGQCSEGCGSLTACGQSCVNTDVDPAHCGGCGTTCDAGQSCLQGQCSCGENVVSFATDIEPLLAGNCTDMGCHGFPMPREGLDLRAGNAYDSLVSVPSSQCGERLRVSPGDVAGSYLVNKLLGADMCFGSRMPKADQSLPAADIDRIRTWICQGAPEN